MFDEDASFVRKAKKKKARIVYSAMLLRARWYMDLKYIIQTLNINYTFISKRV